MIRDAHQINIYEYKPISNLVKMYIPINPCIAKYINERIIPLIGAIILAMQNINKLLITTIAINIIRPIVIALNTECFVSELKYGLI
ncbi:MAG: hypothetical protein ACRC41_18290, partial [Sarcina sp.]